MKSIFKKTTGSPAATDKVGDYNFKESYPDVNMNLRWSDVTPYMRQATKRFIIPFIGRDLYNDIADKVEDNATLSAQQEEFLERLRDAVAYCTVMVMLPKKKTIIASMGAVENVATEGTTTSSLWGFKTTLWSVAQDADRLTDELLQHLEAVSAAGDAYWDLWRDSSAYSASATDLFRTTAEFQHYQNINNSRRTYMAMLPIMRQVAARHILPVLGKDQYDDIVSAILAANPDDDQSALIDKCRAAAAAWTVHYAADRLSVLPDQDGFRVISNSEAIDQRSYSAEVTQNAITSIKYAAEQTAREATADLVAFLHDNADTYTLWKDSSANPDNDDDGPYGPYSTDYGAIML